MKWAIDSWEKKPKDTCDRVKVDLRKTLDRWRLRELDRTLDGQRDRQMDKQSDSLSSWRNQKEDSS